MSNRYCVNKLGLVNFWYYDREEFQLSKGNLLLRGTNGCGKSVTMQSFIPLMLDGNKAPERLDPFGTKARTIANYLLEEDENEKTAYLYMEFKKADTENYITLGMGLKAVRNKPIQSWYFIISDGKRVGKDIFLYRDGGGLIPLTKKQLQNELGTGNFYTETQSAYMEMVNKYLFGFNEIESYEELLNLLISIRSPKLSKDFRPTEIYKILADSLKVLSDEDLRPISDSMENMDSLKDRLDENNRSFKAAKSIKYHYDKYNEIVLMEKGKNLLSSYRKLNDNIKKSKSKYKEYIDNDSKKKELEASLDIKEKEFKKAEESYEQLINKEEYKSKKELEEIKIRLEDNIKSKKQKENVIEGKNTRKRQQEISLKEKKDNNDLVLKKLSEAIKELNDLSEELSMQQCIGVFDKKSEEINIEDFDFCEKTVKAFESKLKELEVSFNKYERQKERLLEVTKDVDKLEVDYIEQKKNMGTTEELFLTEKENYKVHINKSIEMNKLYILNDEEKLKVFNEVDVINEYSQIHQCQNTLENFLNQRINDRNSNISLESKIIVDYEEDIKHLNNAITELRNNKEIQPERTSEVLNNRKRLQENNIPFIPLYKAVDYNKDLSEETRGCIESALINMGLLDALIIDPKYKDKAMLFEDNMEDKYIFSEPNLMSFNLSSILSVDKGLNGDLLYTEVDNVLQSIFLEESGLTYLDEKGNYKIGILGGKAKENYSQKYIGEASRKRHREELIKAKENEIKEIEVAITKHNKSIEYLKSEIQILKSEYERLPHLESILEALKLIKAIEEELKNLDSNIIKNKNKQFEEQEKLNNIKLEIIDIKKGYEYINSLDLVIESLEIISDYKEQISLGKINFNYYINGLELIKQKEDELNNLLNDIDDLYYEINTLNRKISLDEIKENSIIEALSKVNIKEIEEEIDNCLKIKRENPEEIKILSNAIGNISNVVNVLKIEREELLEIIEENKKEYSKAEIIFSEEYDLQYICEKEDGNIIKICEKIIEDLTVVNEKNREYYSNKITEAINQNSADLREYTSKEITLFSDELLNKEHRWLRERRDFRWKIQGKDVNLFLLIDEINKNLEELDLLISEEERKVFEEVLINTISQKVRAKIYQSSNWVKKINELMSSMDTSSSLKLSLAWVPKKSDSENQLDVSKLIDILSRGDRNTEKDLKSLAKHFSEKVKEELRKYEGTGEARNYHSIIKDVLDYRKWYEFRLDFEKNNERKKELTNNRFYQFSGGEKAMSMYIPLFSALYARYDKARGDCPRIISMDEAFAGVDENNIRDMFRLLKELDLQYILNSQILWGDYDTVDALAIAELIREENDDVVTVLKYLWNGKEKVLLDD